MRRRDSAGLALAPLFLRLALALTFIWAGLGKFMSRQEVQGENAAILANYGLIPAPRAAAPANPAPTGPGQASAGPVVRHAAFNHAPQTEGQPEDQDPAQPEGQPEDQPESRPESDQPADTPAQPETSSEPARPAQPRVLATAADFPDPIPVPGRMMLVLALHSAMHPGLNPEDSSPRMRLWPDLDPQTDYDPWPNYFSMAVSITELGGGILIAIGLLTRLAALGIAGVMAGAIWLTVVGPAVQSGNTLLGFLPNHEAFAQDWSMPMWLLTLLCASLALFFSGAGTLSLDRLLAGGPSRPAPKQAKAKPKGD